MRTTEANLKQYLARVVAPAAGLLLLNLLLPLIADEHLRLLIADLITPLIAAWAAGTMFLAAKRVRSESKKLARFWRLVGMAQLALALGEVTWSFYEIVLKHNPFPSFADAVYLCYYPLFLLAIRFLPGTSLSRSERIKNLMDMLIVMLASVLALWNFLLGPLILSGKDEPLLTQLLSLAYPVGDLLQILALLQLVYRLPGHPTRRPLGILAVGGAVTVLMDCIFSYQNLNGTYAAGTILDAGYTAGYLLYGLAGVAMAANLTGSRELEEGQGEPPDHPAWLYHLPYFWVLGAYLLLILQPAWNLIMSQTEIALFLGLIIFLVILRQMVVIRENERLYQEVERQSQELEEANFDLQAEINVRRRAEEKLSHDALHDSLTGLPNRAFFLARLKHTARYKQNHPGFQYAVLFLDLDKFKIVNDSMGHATGDRLLVKVAKILPECVRGTDTVARLGGDEFVLLLEDVRGLNGVLQIAERILNELSRPIELDGTRVFVSASLGIVADVNETDPPDDVLADADLAMYHAKGRGKARYAVFDPQMRALARERMDQENDLRRGLDAGEFCLYYQPIFALPERRLIGMEALARWQHPERGLLLPAQFLRLEEETGLIMPLGERMLKKACRQMRAWSEAMPELETVRVHANLSGLQLRQPEFSQQVEQALAGAGLAGSRLVLEVTEETWCDNQERLAAIQSRLGAQGVEFQVEHFGSGPASFRCLNDLPVQTAKVDKSFIHQMTSTADERPELASALFSLLNELKIVGLAEGIETAEQQAALIEMGCRGGQGFFLARPMSAEQAERWLATYLRDHREA